MIREGDSVIILKPERMGLTGRVVMVSDDFIHIYYDECVRGISNNLKILGESFKRSELTLSKIFNRNLKLNSIGI